VSHITEIAVRDKLMMHDFALTEKYIVLFDLPVTFSLDAAICRYAGRYDVSLMTGPGPISLDRWTIDPASGKVTLQPLSDRFFQEFPRVDDRLISRPHRYGYTTSFKQLQDNIVTPPTVMGHTSGNVLLKHDLERGTVEEHRFEHGAAGEAVFVPVSLGAGEDEGYVMGYAHDLDGGRTDLVILAAQDFTGEPVARIHLPVRVPLGFHGSWIADS
jgi:carotenoid cleavage dioxygenase-like enzyme